MARIRSIKPEITQSESFGRLSREARLFFILLFTIVDDEGRARGSSRTLASLLYPEDRDVDDLIDDWIEELEHERMARRYVVEGSTYIVICNWLTHQKIDHPTKSKLPPPPAGVENPREPSRILAPDQDRRGKEEEKDNVGLAPDAAPPGEKPEVATTRKLRQQAVGVLGFLNEKTGRNYQPVPANVDLIVARLKQGATVEDCRAVVAKKCREWVGDPKMAEYLRPATLFNATKFAQYQGEIAPAGPPS